MIIIACWVQNMLCTASNNVVIIKYLPASLQGDETLRRFLTSLHLGDLFGETWNYELILCLANAHIYYC